MAVRVGEEEAALGRAAAAVAKDWLQRGDRRNSRYAWYDMAAGQRAYRLAYLVDAAVHADALPDQDLAALAAAATDHAERLLDDEFFAGHSNHGYFQIAGMLALGKRLPEIPECLRAREIGLRRLRTMLDEHFTPDGVHREHSPGYHAMMSHTLTTALASGLTDDADVIVLGYQKRSTTGKLLLGSTPLAVMLGAQCPVLAVSAS